MKTRILALVAVLWSFIPGIAFATPPAAQEIDTGKFFPSWVLHEPGSSTITVYGASNRVGTAGDRDVARLRATDNGLSNTYSFGWLSGINTAGTEMSMLVCPSSSFCAGKAFVINSVSTITKCDISGDAMSGCTNIPSFVAGESLGLTLGKIIAQKSSNSLLYLVDPNTGASTLMSSTCSPPGKESTPAGGLAGGFLYLSSNRAGALTDPSDGLPYYDIFRIPWNGTDCTGSATNINNAGTGYAAINTGPGLEIGAVDPLNGSIIYTDWATDHPFVAKKEKNCGDGFIEEGEQCDPNAKDVYGSPPDDSKWQLNAATCLSIPGGFTGGTLKCNPVTCMYDTSSCTAPASCGDGVKNGTDSCDGLDLGSASCTSIPGGFSGGTLACSGSCTFNTSGCYKCGDGTINP
ncbi:hypothetical protein IT412_04460, partial [Candidatus Peregrinibacteria bacterium]|nr:hypothetical protein [Candidatus Peregrinibacteria bacterium]